MGSRGTPICLGRTPLRKTKWSISLQLWVHPQLQGRVSLFICPILSPIQTPEPRSHQSHPLKHDLKLPQGSSQMSPTSTLSSPVFFLVLPRRVCPCGRSLNAQMLLQDLMADLKSELSGSLAKLILGLMLTPAQYDAKQLRKAVEVTAALVVPVLAREDKVVFAVVVPILLVAWGCEHTLASQAPRLLSPIWKESRAESTRTKTWFALKTCWEPSLASFQPSML